jgi:hypothetical protein
MCRVFEYGERERGRGGEREREREKRMWSVFEYD